MKLRLLLVIILAIGGIHTSFGQEELLAFNDDKDKGAFNEELETSHPETQEKIADYYRQHKKLAPLFSGYAIELTTSDLPLRRDYNLFEKFGNVLVHQLPEGGFSYLIKGFRNKKACQSFLDTIVIHQAPEAKIVKYEDGKRKAVRK